MGAETDKLVSRRATFPAYTAKLLLLLKGKVDWKNQSFSSLREMDLDRNLLLEFAEKGFIQFNNCVLLGGYRQAYEATARRHAGIYGEAYYSKERSDPQCDSFVWNNWPLSHELFEAMESGTRDIPIDISDVFPPKLKLKNIWLSPLPHEYVRFDLEIDSEKVTKFLNQYSAAYIAGLVDDDDEHFSYAKQKADIFSFLATKQKEGMGMSNLWLAPPSIWPKEAIFKVRFLETLLAMESEGFIVIKDIVDAAKNLSPESMTTDDHWDLPLRIRVAVTEGGLNNTYTSHNQEKTKPPGTRSAPGLVISHEAKLEAIGRILEERKRDEKIAERITPLVAKILGVTETGKTSVAKEQPHCIVTGRFGYFKYRKQGENIKIGLATSRHFRLLRCLTDPFGPAKTIDAVFEAIRLEKDRDDSRLTTTYQAKTRKVELIKNTIKEIQKGRKLSRIKFHVEPDKIWIELLP